MPDNKKLKPPSVAKIDSSIGNKISKTRKQMELANKGR